jgi:hypothetical protein
MRSVVSWGTKSTSYPSRSNLRFTRQMLSPMQRLNSAMYRQRTITFRFGIRTPAHQSTTVQFYHSAAVPELQFTARPTRPKGKPKVALITVATGLTAGGVVLGTVCGVGVATL